MEKEKLKTPMGATLPTGLRNLRILLNAAQKSYVLEAPLGAQPADDAPEEEKNVFLTRKEDHNLVQCGILYGLEPELRKRFENSKVLRYNERVENDFRHSCRSREL